jgi:hypothetical protein
LIEINGGVGITPYGSSRTPPALAAWAACARSAQKRHGIEPAVAPNSTLHQETRKQATVVAAASEEMSLSISEIGRQVEQSDQIARKAVDKICAA